MFKLLDVEHISIKGHFWKTLRNTVFMRLYLRSW